MLYLPSLYFKIYTSNVLRDTLRYYKLFITEFHFHRGVKALDVGDYKKCLTNMHECHFPLAEAVKHGRYVERIRKEHSVMEADVYMNTAVAESLQSRATGTNCGSSKFTRWCRKNLIQVHVYSKCTLRIDLFQCYAWQFNDVLLSYNSQTFLRVIISIENTCMYR